MLGESCVYMTCGNECMGLVVSRYGHLVIMVDHGVRKYQLAQTWPRNAKYSPNFLY